MDQFLAEYYGTDELADNGVMDDDIEKMAQLTLLTKEAAAEGVDLSEFNDYELLEMADDLYGGTGYGDDLMEKEAAAKFEEADFLGRVMAHSFHQESDEIVKQAERATRESVTAFRDKALAREARNAPNPGSGASGASVPTAAEVEAFGKKQKQTRASSGGGRSMAGSGASGASVPTAAELDEFTKQQRVAAGSDIAAGKGSTRVAAAVDRAKNIAAHTRKSAPNLARHYGSRALKAGRRAAPYAAGGLALAGAGAAGGYALRDKRSADTAFEQLVAERANEHLEAAGLIQKEAAEEDDFETMVDRAALEVLSANGFDVEWY